MYRACRWTASASKALREAPLRKDEKLLRTRAPGNFEFRRNNSVSAAKSSYALLKIVGSGILAAGTTIGGAIFYAGRDEQIRKDIESKVPYSKNILTSIYGDKREKKVVDEEMGSLLPLAKKSDAANESLFHPKDIAFQNKDSSFPTANVVEDLPTLSENLQDTKTESKKYSNVVVITTMDDQAGVSSIDLDIGNAMSSKEKQVAKKSNKIKRGKEVAEKTDIKETLPEPKGEKDAPKETVTQTLTGNTVTEEKETVTDKEETVTEEKAADHVTIEDDTQMVENGTEMQIPEPSLPMEPAEVISQDFIFKEELSKEEIESLSELVDKTAMECLVQASVDKLQLIKDVAVEKQTKASDQIRQYISQLRKATEAAADDEHFDDAWKAAADLEHQSQASIDDARDIEMKMHAGIESIHEMIKAARIGGISEVADSAQEFISRASIDLLKSTEDVTKACQELNMFDQLHGMVHGAKDKVEKEIKEIMPELLEASKTDSDEENHISVRDVMIAYTTKKIDFLKKEIEKIKQEESERTESLLKLQSSEEEKRTKVRLQSEAERLQKEFELQSEKKESELCSYYENEIRKQLKRQSAAHREHLSDVLQAQSNLLSAQHQHNLDTAVSTEKQIHIDELARVAAHLHGVESMIDSVVDVEKANRTTRELWLAVQSLGSVLNEEVSHGRTRNLLPEIVAIHKLAGEQETVQLVLSTIPETAAVQGVSTEGELKKRFVGVKQICKRVAMVGENQGSLWTYALSAIRSFLVLETAAKSNVSSEIDPETISTYDILAKAQKCIDDGDFELAVKFMCLLRGVSRKLASDWLRESKAYLETKLASDFLLAYVASKSGFQIS